MWAPLRTKLLLAILKKNLFLKLDNTIELVLCIRRCTALVNVLYRYAVRQEPCARWKCI